MAANNIKQQTTLTMADGRRIKYTVLKRSSAGATMAKRSWNNAAPKGSFMHAGMPTHMAHINKGNKASKAAYDQFINCHMASHMWGLCVYNNNINKHR